MKKILISISFIILLIYISCKKDLFSLVEGNKNPIANAGTDQTILLPVDSVILDGSASNDPDGTISSFQWTKISGPVTFTMTSRTLARIFVKNLSVGVYQFELKVVDNAGLFAKDTVLINVSNQVPVVYAGADQTITLPLDSVYLDGSGSIPNGWSLSSSTQFVWTKISGPNQFQLKPVTLQQTLLISGYVPTTALVKNLIPGTYLFKLQVANSLGVLGVDTVQVNVVNDPLDPNTVTFRDLIWKQGDVYGTGSVDLFLSSSIRPDLFLSINSTRSIEVYLKLNTSWVSVPFRGNNPYTFDAQPLILWIINYPNNPLLVGSKAAIKIKFI